MFKVRTKLGFKLFLWSAAAVAAAFFTDLLLHHLGWENTAGAEVEAVITISLMVYLYFLARKLVLLPLKEVEEAAEKVKTGDLSARTHITSSKEFQVLSETLNSMMEELSASYKRLQDYNVTLERTVEERTQALAVERDKLSAIFRSIPDGILFIDTKSRITEANAMMEKIAGVGTGDLAGRDVSALAEGPLKPLASYGRDAPEEVEVRGRQFKVTNAPVMDGKMRDMGRIKTLHDVTEEKLLERRKMDFVSLLTHDLKSPLTSILGYGELLMSGEPFSLGDKERECIVSMVGNGRKLLEMVEQYLDITKIESGMFRLDIGELDPRAVLHETLQDLRIQSLKKGVRLEEDIPEGLPALEADRDKFTRIVTNLVTNAIKYTPEGGTVSVSARGLNDEEGGRLVLTVRDTGYGIPEEHLPHIFDRYYRTPDSYGIKGTGLGLAVVKSLVEAHGGAISVESVHGSGSAFTVKMPLRAAARRVA